MTNKKCPNCGFINFFQDESCRKCETFLGNFEDQCFSEPSSYRQPGLPYGGQTYPNHYAVPPAFQKRSIPIFRIIGGAIGIFLLLAIVGGVIAYTKRIRWQVVQGDGSEMVFH